MSGMTFSHQDGNLDNIIDQLKKMISESTSQKKTEKNFDAQTASFDLKFDALNSKINPLIRTINEKLDGSLTLHLFSHKSINKFNPNRKFWQIVLSKDAKHPDLLHSPYLLIEGYPKSGMVRFINSNKEDEGITKQVDAVNEQLLSASMSEFLTGVTALRYK